MTSEYCENHLREVICREISHMKTLHKIGSGDCLGFLLLQRDTMTMATFIKKTFNRGGLLIVSEVQSLPS